MCESVIAIVSRISNAVRQLDTNLSLLLDVNNKVWAVKNAGGAVLSRNYFEKYNIEVKNVGLIFGPFVAALGAILLVLYFGAEWSWKTWPAAERAKLEVDRQGLLMGLSLVLCLILYAILADWLLKFLPGIVVSMGWVLSAGVLMRLLSKKRRPPAP